MLAGGLSQRTKAQKAMVTGFLTKRPKVISTGGPNASSRLG
jgi:hypothetical protein